MKTTDLFDVVRLFISEDSVKNRLNENENRKRMQNSILNQMNNDLAGPTEEMKNLYTGILVDLEAVLNERVKEIELLLS